MATEYPALTKCFLDAIDKFASPRAQMYRTAKGWEAISSAELLRRVAGLSKALRELGVKPGDRVGLFAPNCPEWHVADFAIQGLGAVNVPVYFNESPDRLNYILNDSGAQIVITVGDSQARKLAESRAKLTEVQQVISAAPLDDLHGDVLLYERLIANAGDADVAEYRRRAAEVNANQLVTIIYTSGTTGEPKGVMLNHSNLSSNVLDGVVGLRMGPPEVGLSFLPLAHVYERIVAYGYLFNGVSIAYVGQNGGCAAGAARSRIPIAPRRCRDSSKRFTQIFWSAGHHEAALEAKSVRLGAGRRAESRPVAGVREGCAVGSETALVDREHARLFENSHGPGKAEAAV